MECANRRSFDCGTHDKTVSAFAQDDTLFVASEEKTRG
jgi:hypothetical protein